MEQEKKKRGPKLGQKRTLRVIPPLSIKIKSIKLNTTQYIGIQLKPYRLYFGYNYREFAVLSGIELTLLCHFENHSGPMKSSNGFGWGETAIKYLKAIGVDEVIIKI